MKTFLICCVFIIFVFLFLLTIWAISNFKKHNFEGACQTCHANNPEDNKGQGMVFTDEIERLCVKCHAINQQKSHPINMRPSKDTPLVAHLNKNGFVTCATCHDVHKEDKTSNTSELAGLLWGHTTGRAFCDICHNSEALESKWRHQTAIQYAHPYGKLIQDPDGALLDKYSIECLSCHDGTVSKFPRVEVKKGIWQHGIGDSHPIGIDYPRSNDLTDPESLPKEVRLFNGRVGCLSCHEIYSKERNMLVMNNRGSRLCMTCHKM